MDPTVLVEEPTPRPSGSFLRRGLRAVLHERRLPYRVETAWERLALSLGMRRKAIRAEGLDVVVRRGADDEVFVRQVLVSAQYNPPGYEIGETDTVIDVGGNIGSFAMLAGLRARRGRVITIEPVAANFALLEENLTANRLGHVKPIRAAVLDRPGIVQIRLNPDPNRTGTHSFRDPWFSDSGRVEIVPAVTLPEVFDGLEIEQCDFLKLDCTRSRVEGDKYARSRRAASIRRRCFGRSHRREQLLLSRYCEVTHGSNPRVGYLPQEWVESVEDNVRLNKTSEEVVR
jgi:FkbM family methyltransferase